MRGWGRVTLISTLLVAAIALVTSGTMAFYNYSLSADAQLRTADYVLRVNESTGASQTFSDMTLSPGGSYTRAVKIDTSGLDAATALTVTLEVQASGALPSGLRISLDGAAAVPGSAAVRTVDDAQGRVINMDVAAAWTAVAGENLEPYRGLVISYVVTVDAQQKGGG